MSDPFEPPDVAPGRTQPPLGVIATWAVTGAIVGTGLGNTLHMTGVLRDATAAMGLGGAALLVGLCLVLLGVERRHARARRPLHPSARGEVPPPIHGLLFAPPLALLIPSLLWLGVVGSVTLGNLAPAVVFGAGAIGAAWAGVKVGSAHRLTMAIEDLYRGDVERARGLLQALAGHPLATRRTRRAASENLGAMALNQGDAASAVHWYEQAGDRASVLAGLALARLIQGRADLADGLIRQALQATGARAVQREIDAVRVLLVWRTEGVDAARELADRMDRPGAGPLFRALRAQARGEPLDTGVPPGLVAAVPELSDP